VTIVVPAISLKGAKNQLRRETGVPGPTPLSAEWMEKGRAGVGPIVAGVSHRRSSESRLFSSPGRSCQTMTPHWPGRFFSDLEAQSTIQIHKPLPDPFKKGTIGAARENLPPVADRSRFVRQGGEITSGMRYVAAPGHLPSHASILFASGKEQFMHMGDIAHNPATSLLHRNWTPIFDCDPAPAINSRKAILDRVATDGIMAMGYHFSFPAIGHVVKHDRAYRWEAAHWAW
jgi:hypothetical protein